MFNIPQFSISIPGWAVLMLLFILLAYYAATTMTQTLNSFRGTSAPGTFEAAAGRAVIAGTIWILGVLLTAVSILAALYIYARQPNLPFAPFNVSGGSPTKASSGTLSPVEPGMQVVFAACHAPLCDTPAPQATCEDSAKAIAFEGSEMRVSAGPRWFIDRYWWRVDMQGRAGWMPDMAHDGTPTLKRK